MAPAQDLVSDRADEQERDANHGEDDAEGPEERDRENEAQDEQDDSEHRHVIHRLSGALSRWAAMEPAVLSPTARVRTRMADTGESARTGCTPGTRRSLPPNPATPAVRLVAGRRH